jgi:molybdenum cofactor cytidylyltransferase
MFFGPLDIRAAKGAVVAHAVKQGDLVLKKGTIVDDAAIAALVAAGIAEIVVARLDHGDVPEDAAAAALAGAVAGPGVNVEDAFTGRANMFADTAGVLVVAEEAIDRLNRIDEAVTLATLPAFKPVVAGEMVATVKVIPYAVPDAVQAEALDVARSGAPLVQVAPFVRRRIGVVSTRLPGLADKVIAKTLKVTRERLRPMGADIVAHVETAHETAALTSALADVLACDVDLAIVFGASAIADRRDVIPSAIEAAGGRVDHFGMPVDPGNLMLIGEASGRPVIGAPGCARSPKENGFDWVLSRLVAGLAVTRHDVTGMGVGGLLMEIVTRPQPRAGVVAEDAAPRIAGMVLAAGRSTRMGASNKLTADLRGQPLVRHAVSAVVQAGLAPVLVVTGHQADAVEAALAGMPVRFVRNPRYSEGLSTSLAAGIAALPETADAVIVALGDMPRIDAAIHRGLAAAFAPGQGVHAVVPVAGGRRGNPVLWGRRFFPDLMQLSGDSGARGLIAANPDAVAEVPVEGDSVEFDVDTPDALAEARRSGQPV